MTNQEAIKIIQMERNHCASHNQDIGKSDEYHKEMQDMVDAFDLAIKALEERPKGKLIEFADYVARNVVNEDFSEDVDLYAEVLCRKLVKLGLVKLDGDTYKYCGADMRKGGAV